MYKLVNHYLQSFMNDYLQKNFRIQYSTDCFVYPTIEQSKMFVFDNLENANTFISKQQSTIGSLISGDSICDRLFKCEVINPVLATGRIPTPYDADAYWKVVTDKPMYVLSPPPKGTYFVDAVKLVKELTYSHGEGFFE